ncbi:hypothetical protein BBD42_08360 [Paenibacillus sp. BIHB 4019]|uniref:Uncharacterized protein n=1 Tax=Paenibacillus sp. BIHB 4019 TaxID=1870819 RepID=A0A1B2DFJ7_9BACL|nr:hypothetical protein BBD42_08360 [Paenibacillus sp. BIHB 4019]
MRKWKGYVKNLIYLELCVFCRRVRKDCAVLQRIKKKGRLAIPPTEIKGSSTGAFTSGVFLAARCTYMVGNAFKRPYAKVVPVVWL